MKFKNLWLAASAGALAAGSVLAGSAGWVAQPGKSLDVEWKAPKFAGKDCWTMVWEGMFNAEGVKDEPFVKESGIAALYIARDPSKLEKQNTQGRSALAVREMSVFDDTGAALPPETWKVEASSGRSDVEFFHLDALKDGVPWTAFVAAGDVAKQAFNETLPVAFTITLDKERGVGKIALRHGLQGKACAGKLSLSVKSANGWKPVECARKDKGDSTELTLAKPERGKEFQLACETLLPKFVLHLDKFKFPKELLKERPWCLGDYVRGYVEAGNFPLPEQMDKASFEAVEKEFSGTHMGFTIPAEWDSSMVTHTRWKVKQNPDSIEAQFLPPYSDRAGAYDSVKKYYDYLKALGYGNVSALSGGLTMQQYAAEWGAKTIVTEVSGSNPSIPVRSTLLFGRSASRQCGPPWGTYIAVFFPGQGAGFDEAHPGFDKPGYGKAASQFRREWLTGYYLGSTFFDIEGQVIGTLLTANRDDKKKYTNSPLESSFSLSPHGEVVKEFYNWTHSDAGARGTSYTPILFLTDIRHGRFGRRHASTEGQVGQGDWKIWVDLELEDSDYMLEHFVRTVDKFINSRPPQFGDADKDGSKTLELCLPGEPEKRKCAEEFFAKLDPKVYKPEHYRAPYSPGVRNSRIGEIYDVFFANPPSQGGVIKKEHLDKYAAALLMGEIEMTDALAGRLKTYVKEGGTLMINSAQCKGLMADEDLLGLTVGPEIKEENQMEILPVTLKTAEVVLKSDQGTPLVTRNRYGKGHVLVTTPRYMLLKDRKEPNPLIETMLAKLQDETLPIKFEGNCLFLLNKVSADNWRAVLMNNEGVVKHGGRSETLFLKCYDAMVTLDAPAGVKAKEVFTGAALEQKEEGGRTKVKVLVPAGQVRVVEFTGVKL